MTERYQKLEMDYREPLEKEGCPDLLDLYFPQHSFLLGMGILAHLDSLTASTRLHSRLVVLEK
jgi:hypothetical protein